MYPPRPNQSPITTLPPERLHERRNGLAVTPDGRSLAMPPSAEDGEAVAPRVLDEAAQRAADDLILLNARKQFHLSADYESAMRQEMMIDLRFKVGDQWPDQWRREREADQRPCITVNRLGQFIKQITNPERANRPGLQVNPVGDGADPDTAEVIQGLIRHIEATSHAEVAYDQAYEDAVSLGRGWFRVLTQYGDDSSFDQEIVIQRVGNPFTVYPDPACQELDYSDARFMFVVEDIPRDEFISLYGEESASSASMFQSTGDGNQSDWFPEGRVRIAEYWYVEIRKRVIALVAGAPKPVVGPDGRPAMGPDGRPQMQQTTLIVPKDLVPAGMQILQEREVSERVIQWIKMTGSKVLERQEWPGKWIPIIPVIGEEINIDGRKDLRGIIRGARDPQRYYNFWVPLALDTPVPTPRGWTALGDIEVGDIVFAADGHPTSVVGLSAVYQDRECFRVTFDDGSSVVADGVHPWQVERRRKKSMRFWQGQWDTAQVTTADLRPGDDFIWTTKPLLGPHLPLPIHPYVLGVWLGDGDQNSGRVTQGKRDIDQLREQIELAGWHVGDVGWDKRTSEGVGSFTVYGLRTALAETSLLHQKRIPSEYLRASFEQRLALLQGLMDSDGSVSNGLKVCEFSTTSETLRDDFTELLRTFGIKAKWTPREDRDVVFEGRGETYVANPTYQFYFSYSSTDPMFFRLPRKVSTQASKLNHHPRRTKRFGIVSVERVESVPVRCLAVEHPSHLFLVGEAMIPTHNTAQTEMIALAPRAPYIGAEGSFSGHEQQWKVSNRRNLVYLEYKPKSLDGQPIGPPQRQQYEPPIQAITKAVMQADNDLKSVIGFYDASLGKAGPEESGRAILARQKQGETANSNWLDNLGRALWHLGRILLDLIPKVYDAPRMVHILGGDDQQRTVRINVQWMERGVPKLFDVRYGRYAVVLSIGPKFATRRGEAVSSMLELVHANPQIFPIIGDLMVSQMDWPNARQIAERLKKTLPPNLQDDDDSMEIPPAVAAKMAEMDKQVQMLTQAYQEASDVIRTKQLELASKEYQAALAARTQLAIALEKVNATLAQSQLTAEIGQLNATLDAQEQRIEGELSHIREVDMMVRNMAAQAAAQGQPGGAQGGGTPAPAGPPQG